MAESQTRMLWTLAAGRASQLVRKRGTIHAAIWPPSCAPQRSLIRQRSGGHENGGDAHQNKHRDDGNDHGQHDSVMGGRRSKSPA